MRKLRVAPSLRSSLVLVGLGTSLALAAACGAGGGHGSTMGAAGSAGSGGHGGGPAECAAPRTACPSGCVDTAASPTDCGGCGRACGSGESCCGGGQCSSDPACGLTVTSITPSSGNISGGAYVTVHGTGFAAGLRAYVGDGRAPVRVLDATTALILTPPALEGIYDVRVRVGSESATLPAAFSVASEAFGAKWIDVSMSTPRGNFPAMTTLQDGRVLIEGGTATSDPATALASAELYDPVSKKTSLAAGAMAQPRHTTAAITLLDGRALIVGTCNVSSGPGCVTPGDRAVAELFDPTTNTFSLTKTPLSSTTRVYFKLTLLPDGRVLVVSGGPDSGKAEVFDPATDGFSDLPVTSSLGSFGFPARLRDGRVLFVSAGLEVYDPDAQTVTTLGGTVGFAPGAVYTLPDGRVGTVGGTIDTMNAMVTPIDEVSAVDATKAQITMLTQKLSSPRIKFASALLGSGVVMVAGGVQAPYPVTYGCQSDTFPTTSAVDAVDFASGTVAAFPPINDSNMELVATTLLDGSILVGGGAACGGAGAYPYVYFLEGLPIQK